MAKSSNSNVHQTKRDLLGLSAADARIDAAIESTRVAMTGYVALQAAPERGAHTHRLFEQLDTALDALVVARAEVNRLIGEAQK